MSIKTLCIFSPAFPDETEPFWLVPVQVLVRALNTNFPKVNIIIFSFEYPLSIKTYVWNNNLVIPFNGIHKNKPARLLMWMRILQSFYKIKKNNDVIGILSFWCRDCTFIAHYCKKLFNIKYYCWIFGQDARKNNKYVKRIRPEANSLIALSDFIQEEFYKNHGINPRYIIPKGIDTTLFESGIVNKDIDILGAGSLISLKQYDIFIEIIAELKKQFPSIKTGLCGDGEERKKIENLIAEKNLTNNVKLHGLLPHKKTLRLMQSAKIFLHPSSYEGFGVVCIEALYAGAHVISFCRPMKQDIKNWHIVKTKEEMLLKALELLTNPSIVYERVLPFTDKETAKAVMHLFNYD